jgi:isochorismate synthase EntC
MSVRARSTFAIAAVSVISKYRHLAGTPNCANFSCMNSANSGLESVCPERLIENSAGAASSRALARRR